MQILHLDLMCDPATEVAYILLGEVGMMLFFVLIILTCTSEAFAFESIAPAILQRGLKNENVENLSLVHEIKSSKRTDGKVKSKVMQVYSVVCRFTEEMLYTHIYRFIEMSPLFPFETVQPWACLNTSL